MRKHLILSALCCAMALFFTSCGNKNNIIGTWVEPKAESSFIDEQGFTLLEDGGIVNINNGNYDYRNWEKQGDKLILTGAYTGMNPHDFCDTMNIVEITEEHMILEQGGYQITYVRK